MANLSIKNAEYVEVIVPNPNTKSQIYFPDLPNLRNKPIFGIEAYSSDEQLISFSGANVVDTAMMQTTTITLYFDGGEYIQVPLLSLRRISFNNFFFDIPTLAGQNIVWTKSYVTLNDTPSTYQGYNFVFNVYYNR